MDLKAKFNSLKKKKEHIESLSNVDEKVVENVIKNNQEKRKKLVISLGVSIALAIVIVLIFNCFYAFVTVNGDSMYPTYSNGKSLLMKKTGLDNLENGDIIVFKNKSTNGELFIKRIIAKSGDQIMINGLKVFLNGEILDESYVNDYYEEVYTGVIEIPEGFVYVMGDNRDNSVDSRNIGLISKEDIVGKIILND